MGGWGLPLTDVPHHTIHERFTANRFLYSGETASTPVPSSVPKCVCGRVTRGGEGKEMCVYSCDARLFLVPGVKFRVVCTRYAIVSFVFFLVALVASALSTMGKLNNALNQTRAGIIDVWQHFFFFFSST